MSLSRLDADQIIKSVYDGSGALVVDASGSTQPVSGTVTTVPSTPTAKTIKQAGISVGTSAVRLTTDAAAPDTDRVLLVANIADGVAAKFYIGSATVTSTGATQGIELIGGQSFVANYDAGDYYIISDTASQTVLVLEQE